MSSGTARADGGIGVAAGVLFLVGFGLLATPPAPDAPAAAVADYLTSHRSRVFASAIVIAAAAVLFVWFAAALHKRLGGGTALTGAVLMLLGGVTVVVTSLGVLAGLVLHADRLRPGDAV